MLAKIHPHDPQFARHSAIDDKLSKVFATSLTVWKKSLVYSCNGFTVFNSNGNLAFRVDNYPSDPNDKIILMDAVGMALFTMRRKRLSLQNEWQGFPGEFRDARKPLFVMRRAPSLLIFSKNFAEVYVRSWGKSKKNNKPQFDYRVEGCYAKRSFTILNRFNEVVAEVKPKQVTSDIRLGGDVFSLTVWPGYDQAFVMGLIIVLDQIMPSTENPSIPDNSIPKGRRRNIEKGITFRFPKSFGIGIDKFCQTINEDVESRCLVLRDNYRIAFSAGL